MSSIYLMHLAMCLSCVVSSLSPNEFIDQKLSESSFHSQFKDNHRKLDFQGKQKKNSNQENFVHNNGQNTFIDLQRLAFLSDGKNEDSNERFKRTLSKGYDRQLQPKEKLNFNHNMPLGLLNSTMDPEIKNVGFTKTKNSYEHPFHYLQPHFFDRNQQHLENFASNPRVGFNENDNVTIFSFVDQNGNVDFNNNFTQNLLNAIRHGPNIELLENITKIASKTLRPDNFPINRWSSDWFELSLKNQPSNDAKISTFNRLLGLEINDSSIPFRNKTTNSNYSLIQILRKIIENPEDLPEDFYQNHSSDAKKSIIGNVVNSIDSKTYSNSEILNYIVDKIKRTSLDVSQNFENHSHVALPSTKLDVKESSHDFLDVPTSKFSLYLQNQIPQKEFMLGLSQPSIKTMPTKPANKLVVYSSLPQIAQWNDKENDGYVTNAPVAILSYPTTTFPINLDSIQFLLPQDQVEATFQIHPTKIMSHLRSKTRYEITSALYDHEVNKSNFKTDEEFGTLYVASPSSEHISMSPSSFPNDLYNSITIENVNEISHTPSEEFLFQPMSQQVSANIPSKVPSYYYISQSKTRQLKFIVGEFLASHILKKYNFPTEQNYKNNSNFSNFYANVQNWAGNLSESLLMNPERMANSSSMLLRTDVAGGILKYILQMTDEGFTKELNKNKDSMTLAAILEQLYSEAKEEYYSQADINSIKEFIKIIFNSSSHLRFAIDQSFQKFAIRSDEINSQGLNENRQILSSLYSSSQVKTSVNLNEAFAAHNDATSDVPKTTITSLQASSTNLPSNFFDTHLLTLQKPLSDIFNAHTERLTASIRSVTTDLLPFTTKFEYLTKIFYSNNYETSTVVTKTQVLAISTLNMTKESIATTSPHHTVLALKSSYLTSLAKPLTSSIVYHTLNFPRRSKTDTHFTINVSGADTDTKYASMLSSSLNGPQVPTFQNSETLIFPPIFPHENEFSTTTKPLAVNHLSYSQDFSAILNGFINKLLLLQILLLMVCENPLSDANQVIQAINKQGGSGISNNTFLSPIPSQNFTSDVKSMLDSHFIGNNNLSEITKALEMNLASLREDFSISKLHNGNIPFQTLFTKNNQSIINIKNLLNNIEAHQHEQNNVNANNLVLKLQNAIDAIINTGKFDDANALKVEVSKLDKEIVELEKQILKEIDLKSDNLNKQKVFFNLKIPILATSFSTPFDGSQTPSLSSFGTPYIAEIVSTFEQNKSENNTQKSTGHHTLQHLELEQMQTSIATIKSSSFSLDPLSIERETPSYLEELKGETKSEVIKTSTITVYHNLLYTSLPLLTQQKISTATKIPNTQLSGSSVAEDSQTRSNIPNEILQLFQGYSSTLNNYLQIADRDKIFNHLDQVLFSDHNSATVSKDTEVATTITTKEKPLNTFDMAMEEKIPKSTCDGIGASSKINFINPSYPYPDRDKGMCTFRLYILDPLVCQVRVEFTKSVMIAPTEGQCLEQVFGVQGTIEVPALNSYCGTNIDQHFYIQLKNNTLSSTRWIDFSLNTLTNKHYYKYDILISQIRCVDDELLYAPRGCLQFHSGSLGILKSFNFEEKEYFSDMNYNICIKKTSFGCDISFIVAAGDFAIQKLNSRLVPFDSAGVGIHTCPRDYLQFMGLSSQDSRNGSQRICGAKFSNVQGDLINRPIVIITVEGFYLIKVKTGNPFTFDKQNRGTGFRLSFHQRADC